MYQCLLLVLQLLSVLVVYRTRSFVCWLRLSHTSRLAIQRLALHGHTQVFGVMRMKPKNQSFVQLFNMSNNKSIYQATYEPSSQPIYSVNLSFNPVKQTIIQSTQYMNQPIILSTLSIKQSFNQPKL
jgi:hypothetical protein